MECVCVCVYSLFQVLTTSIVVFAVVVCWALKCLSTCQPLSLAASLLVHTPPALATPLPHACLSHMLSPALWQFIDIHLPPCVCVCLRLLIYPFCSSLPPVDWRLNCVLFEWFTPDNNNRNNNNKSNNNNNGDSTRKFN